MSISLKTEHLKRYKDVAWLLMKYGRSEWNQQLSRVDAEAAFVN
jgi:hypothetical protein